MKLPSFPLLRLRVTVLFGVLLFARNVTAAELPLLQVPWLNSPKHRTQHTALGNVGYQTVINLPIVIAQPALEKYPADNRAFELEVLRLINEQRGLIGLPLLTEHNALTQAARRHAEDMATYQSASHIGSDGSTPGDRVVQEGYSGLISGEALSIGRTTPAEVILAGWMNSPAHRAILLDPNATEAGMGYADGFAWTLDTGRHL